MPSGPVALLLMAALLAIFAAAQPGVRFSAVVSEDLSIVLDRGASMALPSLQPYRGVLQRCADRVGAMSAKVRVTLVPVPGQAVVSNGEQWLAIANALPPTVIRTRLDQAIDNQLRTTHGPVLVLSDQKLSEVDPRVIQIVPQPAEDGVAITLLSARSTPKPQAMVRIENHSDRRSVRLVVTCGSESVTRVEPLPPRGQSVDLFIDLQQLRDSVTAQLPGETGPWSTAFAAQRGTGIRMDVDADLDAAIRKMSAVYSAHRPVAVDAPWVRVTNRPLSDQQSGIWIQTGTAEGLAGSPTVVADDLTRNVSSWPAAGSATMPAGFSPIVSTPRGVVVAMRDQPRRAVWVNAQILDWEKTPDFVVFFANAFDWLAGDELRFEAIPPAELGGDWRAVETANRSVDSGEWPGLYRSTSTGKLVAVNAGEYPPVDRGIDSAAAVARQGGVGIRRIDSWLLLAALFCGLVAMGLCVRMVKSPVGVL